MPTFIQRATASDAEDIACLTSPASPASPGLLLSPTASRSPSSTFTTATSYMEARGPSSIGSACGSRGNSGGGPSSGSDGGLSMYEIQRAEIRAVDTGPHSGAATPVIVAISPSPSSMGIWPLGAVVEPLISRAPVHGPRVSAGDDAENNVAPAVPRPKKSNSKGKGRAPDGTSRRDTLLAAKKRRRASTVAVSLSAELLEDDVFPGGQLPDAQSIASFAYYGERSRTAAAAAKEAKRLPTPSLSVPDPSAPPARGRQSRSSFSLSLLARLNPVTRSAAAESAAPPPILKLPPQSMSPASSTHSSTVDSAEFRSHPWNATVGVSSKPAAGKLRSAESQAAVLVESAHASTRERPPTTRRRPSSTASLTPYLRSTSPSSRHSTVSTRSVKVDESRPPVPASGNAGVRRSPPGERESPPPVPPLPAALTPPNVGLYSGSRRLVNETKPDDGADSDEYDVLDITHVHPTSSAAITSLVALPQSTCCASCSAPLSRQPSSDSSRTPSVVDSPDFKVDIDLPPAGLGIDHFLDELDYKSSQWNLAALAAELQEAEEDSDDESDAAGVQGRDVADPDEAPAFGHDLGSGGEDDGESDGSLNPSPRTPSLSAFACQTFDAPVAATPVLGLILETEEREDDSLNPAWSVGLANDSHSAVAAAAASSDFVKSDASRPVWAADEAGTADLSAVNLESPSARRRSRRAAGLSPTASGVPFGDLRSTVPISFGSVDGLKTPPMRSLQIDGVSPSSTVLEPQVAGQLVTYGPSSTAAVDLFGRLMAADERDELSAEATRRPSINTFGVRRPSDAIVIAGPDEEDEVESVSLGSLAYLAEGAVSFPLDFRLQDTFAEDELIFARHLRAEPTETNEGSCPILAPSIASRAGLLPGLSYPSSSTSAPAPLRPSRSPLRADRLIGSSSIVGHTSGETTADSPPATSRATF